MDPSRYYMKSPSYFWSCITLNKECPFFSDSEDPYIHYFALGVFVMYCALLIIVLGDTSFFWTIGNLQYQVEYYINLVRTKVKRVQMDQNRLMSTNERTEKQLKRTQECMKVVNALRGTLSVQGMKENQLSKLTNHVKDKDHSKQGLWNDVSLMDF